jgi:hypothetical protein
MILFEQGELSSSSKMNTLIYIIVFFAILLFSIRAALGYRSYKRSIYPHIYDNYLFDYFYKLNVFRDASRSGYLKRLLGYHRLVYANLTNKEGKLCAQILTLIHSKGILSIAHLHSNGSIHGSDQGNWYVKRIEEGKEKKFKIENPGVYLKEYISHLTKTLSDRKVQSIIAINDECDISDVHSSFRICKFSELESVIKEADCGYGLNDSEIDEIYTKLGGKLSR